MSASPETLGDSAPQLTQCHNLYNYQGSFNQTALPDPTHLRAPTARRRTKTDRRLLSELGRTKNIPMRRSSHKAMGKRMFFLLSGRHRMQKQLLPSHENFLRLDKRSFAVSQCCLPSFRDGFSDWVQDTRPTDPMQLEVDVSEASRWQESARLGLPSVLKTLGSE